LDEEGQGAAWCRCLPRVVVLRCCTHTLERQFLYRCSVPGLTTGAYTRHVGERLECRKLETLSMSCHAQCDRRCLTHCALWRGRLASACRNAAERTTPNLIYKSKTKLHMSNVLLQRLIGLWCICGILLVYSIKCQGCYWLASRIDGIIRPSPDRIRPRPCTSCTTDVHAFAAQASRAPRRAARDAY
jgi:hypothetical protein